MILTSYSLLPSPSFTLCSIWLPYWIKHLFTPFAVQMAKCSANDRPETPRALSSALEIHHNKQIPIIYSWLGCNLLLQILECYSLCFSLRIHHLCTFFRELWRGNLSQFLDHPPYSSTVQQFVPLTAWQPAVGVFLHALNCEHVWQWCERKSCLKQL